MRPIYEIDKDIEQCIVNGTNFETGEFTAFDELNELQMERDAKLEGVAVYIKDCRAEAKAIEEEIKTLTDRKKKLEKSADGASGWMATNLAGKKFSTSKVAISFRKSESVDVDEGFVDWAATFSDDHELLTRTTTFKPNKAYIAKLLKDGAEFKYARLVEKQNISIK